MNIFPLAFSFLKTCPFSSLLLIHFFLLTTPFGVFYLQSHSRYAPHQYFLTLNLHIHSIYFTPSNDFIPFIIISNDKSKLSLIDIGFPKALLFTSNEKPSKNPLNVIII